MKQPSHVSYHIVMPQSHVLTDLINTTRQTNVVMQNSTSVALKPRCARCRVGSVWQGLQLSYGTECCCRSMRCCPGQDQVQAVTCPQTHGSVSAPGQLCPPHTHTQILTLDMWSSLQGRWDSVQFSGGRVLGVYPPLVEDDPSLATKNIGLGIGNILVIYHIFIDVSWATKCTPKTP